MKPHEILIAARAKIDKHQKWCKGVFSRDHNGDEVSPVSVNAVRFCALGAIRAVTLGPLSRSEARAALRLAAGYSNDSNESIFKLNDHPKTRHADIMALYDRAIEATKGEAK